MTQMENIIKMTVLHIFHRLPTDIQHYIRQFFELWELFFQDRPLPLLPQPEKYFHVIRQCPYQTVHWKKSETFFEYSRQSDYYKWHLFLTYDMAHTRDFWIVQMIPQSKQSHSDEILRYFASAIRNYTSRLPSYIHFLRSSLRHSRLDLEYDVVRPSALSPPTRQESAHMMLFHIMHHLAPTIEKEQRGRFVPIGA